MAAFRHHHQMKTIVQVLRRVLNRQKLQERAARIRSARMAASWRKVFAYPPVPRYDGPDLSALIALAPAASASASGAAAPTPAD